MKREPESCDLSRLPITNRPLRSRINDYSNHYPYRRHESQPRPLEHLCAHLDHMLSEVFILTQEATLLCEGQANSVIQRAGASTVIAMEFREEIIRHVEALQAA